VLVALWLTQITAISDSAYARDFDYLSRPTEGLEAIGRVVESLKKRIVITPGKKRLDFGGTSKDELVQLTFDFETRDSFDLVLQPANNNPDTSGSGLNINNDGSCIVGYQDNGQFTPFHAFRWTEATKAVDLGTVSLANNSTFSSVATDTNSDCSVVVGISNATSTIVEHAFRWTSAGMVDLGVPAGGGPNSRALGVSSDGTVIVGDADFQRTGSFPGTIRQAFRWTQAGGFQNIDNPAQPTLSLATAVSGDGTVVVGQVRDSNTANRAFRWSTQTQIMQNIGPLPGHTTAAATGVSDNGKIVVGISNPNALQYQGPVLGWGQGIAFRWTEAKGTQDLRQILVDGGVDMTGITLVSVTGMSRDGQWIQGAATTPQTGPGETVAYAVQVCDDDIGGPCSTTGVAPFTLGASPNQLTVSAGNSATSTITVTPNAGFTQPVSFSCGNLPVGTACSFNPATVTPAGGPVNTTLTIATNGGAVALLSTGNSPTLFASLFLPVVLIPVGLLMRRSGVDGRHLSIASGCLMALTVVGLLSCSSGDSPPPASTGGVPATGTPAGTSTVSVTATSGGNSSNVPIQLTVTRP
jgi:probable HAF family extracellular repeat protein